MHIGPSRRPRAWTCCSQHLQPALLSLGRGTVSQPALPQVATALSLHSAMATALKTVLLAVICCTAQQRCVAGYHFDLSTRGNLAERFHDSAQYYNFQNLPPGLYAHDLVEALTASGVPLIKPAPYIDGVFSYVADALPEVNDGFVSAMHQALEDGEYRTFGYICMGSISYNPKPNGGEGATGQLNCGTAIAGVIDTANGTVIVQGACNATRGDLSDAGFAVHKRPNGTGEDAQGQTRSPHFESKAQRTPARLQHACEAPHSRSSTVPVSRSQHRKAFSTPYSRQAGTVCQAFSGTLSKPRSGYLSNSFADQDIFLIAGAGIAGLAMAAALTKVGIPCRVLEREAGPRKEGSAIGLWPNAFRALDALGVAEELRRQHPLISRVELCTSSGAELKSFGLDECEGGPHEFRGVKRSSLLDALQKVVPSECVQYSSPIHSVETDQNGAIVTLESGSKLRARCLIGADGGNSRTARALNVPQPNYAGYSAYRGVAVMPQGLPIPGDTVRQSWGQGVRSGMYPLSNTELYWFTCFNAPKDRVADALRYVGEWEGGIQEAIRSTPHSNISRSKLTDRWPGFGKGYSAGAITLAGDAAHPMTPNLGQGGCTALEDAVVLARKLRDVLRPNEASGDRPHTLRSLLTPDLVQVLRQYESERKARTRVITIRSNLMGRALQLPFAPVCALRNTVVEKVYSPRHFLDHATFDCGSLE